MKIWIVNKRKIVGNRKYIREINGEICDIENAQLSFCTTDMNTTTDLENTISTYDEEAIMNITLTKVSNLKTQSNKTENLNLQIYGEKLNNIIQKLKSFILSKLWVSEIIINGNFLIVDINTNTFNIFFFNFWISNF